MNRRHICLAAALFACGLMTGSAFAAPDPALTLARSLAGRDEHAEAALEFRRLALAESAPAPKGAFFWTAGYEYLKASRYEQSWRMLDLAEEAAPAALETEVYLLRGETSRRRGRPREAVFYFESLTATNRPEPVRAVAARKLTAARLQARDFEGARQAMALAPDLTQAEREAVAAYEKGHDKSPMVGGVLGLIPGMGYAYSGEYANATRSLILNALCIWGIVSFAEDETWGGVAVVGFAEITFYSGSIYGGIDSAERYNRQRLERATRPLDERSDFRPDFSALPLLSLQFRF